MAGDHGVVLLLDDFVDHRSLHGGGTVCALDVAAGLQEPDDLLVVTHCDCIETRIGEVVDPTQRVAALRAAGSVMRSQTRAGRNPGEKNVLFLTRRQEELAIISGEWPRPTRAPGRHTR
jgi:hypothetical protein